MANRTELLRQVNAIRVAVEQPTIAEIPKGIPSSPDHCPIANALSNGIKANVDGDYITLDFPVKERHRIPAIADRLRALRFLSVVEIWNVQRDTEEEHEEFGKGKFKPAKIMFYSTKTMENFISAFDQKKFADLIEGK